MEKKSMYESPETEIVSFRVFTPILQDDPIHQGGQSMNNVVDAKITTSFEEEVEPEEIETGIPFHFHNLWDEEEE